MTLRVPVETFGDKLRRLENELQNQNEIKSQEIEYIVKDIRDKALRAVNEHRKEITYNLDSYRLRTEPQLKKGSIMKLELALNAEGLSATYHEDLGCGANCATKSCQDGTHWGYTVSWPQPKK